MAIVIKRREVYDYDTKKHVKADVPTCEECGANDFDYYKYKDKKRAYDIYIRHDALCCSRGENGRERLNESDKAKVLGELYRRASRILGQDLEGVQRALEGLAEFKLDYTPEGFDGSKEDAEAPFFTEAYLYSLLGKDNARTVLAHINAVRRAAGLD